MENQKQTFPEAITEAMGKQMSTLQECRIEAQECLRRSNGRSSIFRTLRRVRRALWRTMSGKRPNSM